MMPEQEKRLAGCIDHTLLDATATTEDIERMCDEAIEFGFHTVCVNGRWLGLVADRLHGTDVKTGGDLLFAIGIIYH